MGVLLFPLLARAADLTPEIRVQTSRPEAPESLSPVERFDSSFIARTDAITVDEVLSQVTADLPGSEQIVLIDGRETQIDISTIPAEMIDHIEVSTTGEMPDGRPRIVGNVINIILKKNYNGVTLSGRQRNSIEGGGAQSQLNASAGHTLGKLSARVNFVRREQDSLRASERDFSRDQDHSEEGGSDYRAGYGESPTVQAADGSIAYAPNSPSTSQPLSAWATAFNNRTRISLRRRPSLA